MPGYAKLLAGLQALFGTERRSLFLFVEFGASASGLKDLLLLMGLGTVDSAVWRLYDLLGRHDPCGPCADAG